MRTREKLIELGNKSEFVLYKRLTEELAKKLFINKWYVLNLERNIDKRFDLYDRVTGDYLIWEFAHVFRKEMKMVERINYGTYKRFDTRFPEGREAMTEFVLTFHLNRIIEEFKK